MWHCARCSAENDSASQMCWMCGAPPNETEHDSRQLDHALPGCSPLTPAKQAGRPSGAPRPFGIRRVMTKLAWCSPLFLLMVAIGVSPLVILAVALFATVMGIALALLSSGSKPGFEEKRKPAGVPRQFGVGKLMAIVAFYSVLFAILSSVGAQPLAFLIVALFVTGIGGAQALLFGGNRPREASILAGGALGMLLAIISYTIDVCRSPWFPGPFPQLLFALLVTAVVSAGVGIACGYCAGCLIAAVFLRRDSDSGKRPEVKPDPPSILCPGDGSASDGNGP
jgi:hypothetical protein